MEAETGEEIVGQNTNGLGAVAFVPTPLFTQAQPYLNLAMTMVDVEIGDRADRVVLFVENYKPELSTIATNVVALKDRQELFQSVRVGAVRVIAPHFVVALPMEHLDSIVHRWTT